MQIAAQSAPPSVAGRRHTKPPAAPIACHAALVDVHLDAVDATAGREAGAGVLAQKNGEHANGGVRPRAARDVHEDREQLERLHDGVDAPRPGMTPCRRRPPSYLVGVATQRHIAIALGFHRPKLMILSSPLLADAQRSRPVCRGAHSLPKPIAGPALGLIDQSPIIPLTHSTEMTSPPAGF